MSYVYEGSELELFAEATNWKSYLGRVLRPFIRGRVLEVGAGIGSNIPFLHNARVSEWTALEPDEAMAARLAERIRAGGLPSPCRVLAATLPDLARRRADGSAEPGYDAILYIDVLEHIAEDAAETAAAATLLAPQGHLVTVSPAHPFLFTPFDAAIGHRRRYTRRSLMAAAPPQGQLVMLRMLDSGGFFASLGNRLLLKSSMPTRAQVRVWDKLLVPVSRVVDPLTGWCFGKTIAGVWQGPPRSPDA